MAHAKHTHRRTTRREGPPSRPEPNQRRRRTPRDVVPAGRFDPMDADSEFVRDDAWLEPYEPVEHEL